MENFAVDYVVIAKASTKELRSAVVEHIGDGWMPTGGVAVDNDDGVTILLQAMVKYEKQRR